MCGLLAVAVRAGVSIAEAEDLVTIVETAVWSTVDDGYQARGPIPLQGTLAASQYPASLLGGDEFAVRCVCSVSKGDRLGRNGPEALVQLFVQQGSQFIKCVVRYVHIVVCFVSGCKSTTI